MNQDFFQIRKHGFVGVLFAKMFVYILFVKYEVLHLIPTCITPNYFAAMVLHTGLKQFDGIFLLMEGVMIFTEKPLH